MEDIARLIPDKGILRDYMDYSLPLSGAPAQYHLFVGLVVIASALGNRVYVPLGALRVCPHLWVALLGPSPLERAGCVGVARRMLARLEETPVVPEPASMGRIKMTIAHSGGALLVWPDLGDALKSLKWKSLAGFRGFLADVLDAGTDYLWEGPDGFMGPPALSILAGCSRAGLSHKVREEEIWGLLPRFLFVPAGEKGQEMVVPAEPDSPQEERIAASLSELARLAGPADLSEVRADYATWCRDHEPESQGVLYTFLAHMPLYLLKLALIYQVSFPTLVRTKVGKDESLGSGIVISREAFASAARCLAWVKRAVQEVVGQDLLFGEARKKARVLRLIEMLPGIPHSKALRHSNMRADQFRLYINTLIEEGSILVEEGRYYPRDPFGDS